MSKKIEISTLNISVNVLMLDNKRFTKSVFNQLPEYSFDYLAHQFCIEESGLRLNDGHEIIGFVRNINGSNYTLENIRGTLCKRSIDDSTSPIEHKSNKDKIMYNDLAEYIEENYSQIFISC
jgi:hypothetical protein